MAFKVIGATSYRTFRVIWMLEELGVPYDHVVAHPRSKLARQYHPLGKIPVLISTNQSDSASTTIYESGAILTYLGDFHQRFVPTGLPRPLLDQTMHMLVSEMDASGLWIHRKHDALGRFFGEAPPVVIQEARRTFQNANQVLTSQLSPYLLGKEFSIVDIMYVHMLDWAKAIGWDYFQPPQLDDNDAEPNKNKSRLSDYVDLCRARPAYKRTVEKRNEERAADKRKAAEKQKEGHHTANL